MSVAKGFDSGFGCVFSVLTAVVVLIIALTMAGKIVTPCPSRFGSGNCSLCGGSGKGISWGDCMNCNGKKKCGNCGGIGWKWK
jgi:hypothetical protein